MQNSCLKNFVKLWRNICDFALGILEFSSLRGEAKQSLGILNLFLGILDGILNEITLSSWVMTALCHPPAPLGDLCAREF